MTFPEQIEPCTKPGIETRIELRKGRERGSFSKHWLQARFSFSFGNWQQPGRHPLGALYALNEDRLQPDRGFDLHGHRDHPDRRTRLRDLAGHAHPAL